MLLPLFNSSLFGHSQKSKITEKLPEMQQQLVNTEPQIQVESITPELAAKYLELNSFNRPLSKVRVNELARRMEDGQWKLNGEAISFSGTRLLNGQHTLNAVIQSGVTIQKVVIRGIEDDAFSTIDNGVPRGGADICAMMGEKHSTIVAGALRLFHGLRDGTPDKTKQKISNVDFALLMESHPGIRTSVEKCFNGRKIDSVSALAGFHYLFSQKSPEEADKFMEDLIEGERLEKTDAVYLLRERLISNKSSKSKLTVTNRNALIIKAWNFRRAGEKIHTLRFRTEGDCPEKFPTIK